MYPIYLVRTACPRWTYDKDATGYMQAPGPGLGQHGVQQAGELGYALAARFVTHVLCSPYARTTETALLASDVAGTTYAICDNLREPCGETTAETIHRWYAVWHKAMALAEHSPLAIITHYNMMQRAIGAVVGHGVPHIPFASLWRISGTDVSHEFSPH